MVFPASHHIHLWNPYHFMASLEWIGIRKIKTRRKEGFRNRLASALWKGSFQLGFWSPSGLAHFQQLEFRHSNVLTAREKVRLEADLKGL
jgi:hypothetical protein